MITREQMRGVIEASVEYEPNTGCWLWSRGVTGNGYGVTGYRGFSRGAHRASWQAFCGELRSGDEVLHRCDTPLCVNPAHLRVGSHAENMADCATKGRIVSPPKTRCPQGHEYTAENTYTRPSGKRECRACRRAWFAAQVPGEGSREENQHV